MSEGLEPYNSHFSAWQLLGLADFDVEFGVLKYRGRHCYLRSATSLGTILYTVTQTVSSEGSIITPGIITWNILITATLTGSTTSPDPTLSPRIRGARLGGLGMRLAFTDHSVYKTGDGNCLGMRLWVPSQYRRRPKSAHHIHEYKRYQKH